VREHLVAYADLIDQNKTAGGQDERARGKAFRPGDQQLAAGDVAPDLACGECGDVRTVVVGVLEVGRVRLHGAIPVVEAEPQPRARELGAEARAPGPTEQIVH
jgi:hypothetical protein